MQDSIEKRVRDLEDQVARIVSDTESEKDSRRRINAILRQSIDKLSDRLGSAERVLYTFTGVVGVLQIITLALILRG